MGVRKEIFRGRTNIFFKFQSIEFSSSRGGHVPPLATIWAPMSVLYYNCYLYYEELLV